MKISDLDNEVEEYRQHALFMIKENSSWIKKVAEAVLGTKVKAIKPIGSVTTPDRFTENSDIDIAIYIETGKEVDEDLSSLLQDEMIKNPINDLGVVNTLVFK